MVKILAEKKPSTTDAIRHQIRRQALVMLASDLGRLASSDRQSCERLPEL